MILGRITGTVVATQKNDRLEGQRILVVQPIRLDGSAQGVPLLGIDRVDAGEGDTVLVNKEGGGARILLRDPSTPVQAIVVAVVDRIEVKR